MTAARISPSPGLTITKYALWSWLGVFSVQTAFATSVVTLIDHTHHRIVIGADSLISGGKGSRLECKIVEKPDCVFVAAGVYNVTETDFHLLELAKTACSSPGDIGHRADEFLRIAKTPADKTAQYIRIHDPAFYEEDVASPYKGYIDVLFAGLDAFGVVEVSSRGFRVDGKGILNSASFDQHDLPPGPTFAVFVGIREDIDVYLKAHRNVWNQLDFAEIAKMLVQVEIDAKPNYVGPPISVLEIDGQGGHTWIQPGLCGQQKRRGLTTPKARGGD